MYVKVSIILFRETQSRESANELLLETCTSLCLCVCVVLSVYVYVCVFLEQQERTFFHLTHSSTGFYLCRCSTLLIAAVILTGDVVVGKGK